ncbi:MAG: hydantoinase/oxoprolinase family protein [Chloroflexi bacterium]|nr:hydantoinase/oxoprolinase family protein [Chloroflexota bacterium]MDA1228702.1 hydantoinase/oxoprolinase family protein [Chloroflexota bacterium]
MRIGLDVGGTNTDAVLMDGSRLVAQAKRPTTADVSSGIIAALKSVLTEAPPDADVQAVMLGTTHFTNALLERKSLAPTAVIRMCRPATTLLPPLVDWPDALREAIGGHSYMLSGGHEFDGQEISPMEEREVREAVKDMVGKGVRAVAVCGVFSPVETSHEDQVASIILQQAPELSVTLSHEIGRVGILERENATALNASLSEIAARTITSLTEAIRSLGLNAPFYLSQNDGTLMEAEFASRYPVFTIASGPTNSMRGAAFLSGVTKGIVLDIGGTTTDGGALVNGFPREASVAIEIAGVRTNFRMPDVLSIALGGGSIIRESPLSVGPDSVGYRLMEQALVFGGNTSTATDLAVYAGRANVGHSSPDQAINARLAADGMSLIDVRLAELIDKLKLSAADVPVILVGGGSILVGDTLAGASEVIRPQYGEVANAIGAAMAQVGGQVEKVYSLAEYGRLEALEAAQREAEDKAVAAGADRETLQVVELEEVPLSYLPSNATRIRIKVVGDLTGMAG